MRSAYIVVLLALTAGNASAQTAAAVDDQPRPRIAPFLEGTDVFLNNHWKDIKFEAHIAPHFFLWQKFGDAIPLAQRLPDGRTRSTRVTVITATPGINLRMYRSISSPVRTPSYMPRVDFQRLWSPDVEPAHGRVLSVVRVRELHLAIGHHSNGQDGCFFEVEARDPLKEKKDCTIPDNVPRTETVFGDAQGRVRNPNSTPFIRFIRFGINKKDGSFSTNYIRLGMNSRQSYVDSTLVTRRHWTMGADAEFHPAWLMDRNIRGTYGHLQFSVSGEYASRTTPGRWQPCRARREVKVSVLGIFFAPVSGASPAGATTFMAACYPLLHGDGGFFVRLHKGRDYYNLGFLDDVTHLQVGLTFDPVCRAVCSAATVRWRSRASVARSWLTASSCR